MSSFPQESFSSYQDYPSARRSLMNDDDAPRKSPRPVNAAPESNSRAVISALLGLQEKIRKLEQERSEAEGNLKLLANETSHYRDSLHRQQPARKSPPLPTSKQSQELRSQLDQAETRSQLLEKQLEYMRNMVRTSEHQRTSTQRQQELEGLQQAQLAQQQTKNQSAKLDGLEREHARLKATQAVAESKIQDLENKVKEERHKREIMQSRSARLETMAESQKILSAESLPQKGKKVKKSKTKPTGQAASGRPVRSATVNPKPPVTTRHLRLQMENVPFIAGKATTPSHNVNVNMQNLIAMMKNHNPAWCSSASQFSHQKKQQQQQQQHSKKPRRTASLTSDSDLSDLLLGLQDEFGQLAFEHQELTKQLHETVEERLQDDLEQELSHVVARMEAKGDQICKLRKHQQKKPVIRKKSSTKSHPLEYSPPLRQSERGGEVKVVTTVKTKGAGMPATKIICPTPRGGNHRVLHDMKTLQTSLRKDDVSWD